MKLTLKMTLSVDGKIETIVMGRSLFEVLHLIQEHVADMSTEFEADWLQADDRLIRVIQDLRKWGRTDLFDMSGGPSMRLEMKWEMSPVEPVNVSEEGGEALEVESEEVPDERRWTAGEISDLHKD